MLHVNNATVLAKNVTGLDKFTEYEFKVLALSSDGDGPKSSVIVVRTKEDGKARVTAKLVLQETSPNRSTRGMGRMLPPKRFLINIFLHLPFLRSCKHIP